MNADDLKKLEAERVAFLFEVYEATQDKSIKWVETPPIAARLGIDEQRREAIEFYLKDEGLLSFPVSANVVELTHYGVKEIERAIREPDKPTAHLLPIVIAQNYINFAGPVTHSQIQQGSPGASQSQQVDTEALRVLSNAVRSALDDAVLDTQVAAEAYADLDSLDAQIKSPKPKIGIVRASLESLQAITTLAGAAGAAPQLAHLAQQIAGAIAALPI